MKKRVSALLSALLLALLLLPCLTSTAWAADSDEIVNYDITVEPNAEDGSLLFTVSFDWKVLEELPHGTELKIGIPNGALRDRKALTKNIERLSNDNSYMFVYLDSKIKAGETVHFSYSWVQEYMYTLDGSRVNFYYTPGWFDNIKIDHMTVTWKDPAGTTSTISCSADDPDCWSGSGHTVTGKNLPHGSQVNLDVSYSSWPVGLNEGMTRDNLPEEYLGGYGGDSSVEDVIVTIITIMFVIFVILVVMGVIISIASRSSYAGGFGTHYVFVNNLWYPAGADGKPKPGSVGTATKPKPAATHSSGFGGGSRGGGFGGGGFGGGSHCACASSCACACACACAGGGRAGCSAKNLYGAVMLDDALSRRLEGKN